MGEISYKGHRFPPSVIRQAVWLYFRFTLSLRDVEEMMAARGVDVTYETIRVWANRFGPQIAANLKRRRHNPSPRWHLDEMVCSMKGERWYGVPSMTKASCLTSLCNAAETRPRP